MTHLNPMSSKVLSSSELRALSSQAGFDLCGFARAEPIPPDDLVRWLEAGMAADMDWMGNRLAERLDVEKLLPGARTVIAFGCNFYQEGPPQGPDAPISRYARGRDYHHNLRDRLRAFRRLLAERHPEVQTYGSIDSGPAMEKVWAARAGLGYVARNALVVTPEYGSYVVLAVLILDAEMDEYASGPTEDRCGNCNLCVNACPTEAIVADQVVDAGKCISYQTIENSEHIPEELRFSLGGLVFGCDLCQEVCPLNDSPVIGQERFAPRAVGSVGVRELAAMTKEQYQQWVPGTPLGRAQYDGLRRNAAYALGALRDEGARELLQRLSDDPIEKVRVAAEWALERLDELKASRAARTA